MREKESDLSVRQRVINDAAAMSKFDWDTIRTSTCSWNFEELSHCAHCRVSPCVVAAARVLCSQFNITTDTRKEIEKFRKNLDLDEDDSSDQVLRMLTASDEGLVVIGICGVLNDYLFWQALAEFFETLAEISGMPEALRPTRGRWVELARIAGRIPPTDSFHTLSHKLSQLAPADKAKTKDLEEGVGPVGVIGCIQTMSAIKSGEDDDGRILMFCGRSAGWHAAIAEWMFGLSMKLTIRDGTTLDGHTLYTNCLEDEVQVVFPFNNPGIPMEGDRVDDPPMPLKD